MVTLSCSNLKKSITFWKDILNMKIYEEEEKRVTLMYGDDQAKLELKEISKFIYLS